VVRLLPGALGDECSAEDETFSESADGGLEYPQYTRPEMFRGMKAPDVLLSGNHGEIEKWRRKQSLERTRLNRPDLLKDKQQ
jgi:tRNA (guanine37-N1)-methyltransferase